MKDSSPVRISKSLPFPLVFAVATVVCSLLWPPQVCMALKQPGTVITATRTAVPPLIDVPTYSMATCNDKGSDNDGDTRTTNMNILTYATPVSVRPDRIYTLGIYKETLSYKNFCRDRTCILQLLNDRHIPLVKLLGGTSGKEVEKQSECDKLGLPWGHLPSDSSADGERQQQPMVLPGCAYYLKLRAIGDLVDCGSHCVAICKVEEMFVSRDDESKQEYMSTASLRDLGIITEQGRVAE